jgi:hypothetical protein
MMRQVTSINWCYIGDAIPAFITLAFMPLSYSVAYGLIAYVETLQSTISKPRHIPDMHSAASCPTQPLMDSSILPNSYQEAILLHMKPIWPNIGLVSNIALLRAASSVPACYSPIGIVFFCRPKSFLPLDKPHNGRLPWFMRAARNGGRFWTHEKPEEDENDSSSIIEILETEPTNTEPQSRFSMAD